MSTGLRRNASAVISFGSIRASASAAVMARAAMCRPRTSPCLVTGTCPVPMM
jgi:hypothetical protein